MRSARKTVDFRIVTKELLMCIRNINVVLVASSEEIKLKQKMFLKCKSVARKRLIFMNFYC